MISACHRSLGRFAFPRRWTAALALLLAGGMYGQTANNHCTTPSDGAPPLPALLRPGQGDARDGAKGIALAISTKNAKAQQFFNQGLAQMHSFWAFEAERSFLQAAALDPESVMPWWGVAMVAAGDYRPHFQLVRDKGLKLPPPSPALLRARKAAQKAMDMAQRPGAVTPLEKLYIEAVYARRFPKKNSDAEYEQGLRRVLQQYPQEVEARTFLALHLMDGFTTPNKTPRPGTMEAVSLLKQLLLDAPDHAGVHHYVIHGYEGSTFAKDAWASCERYEQLAPNIAHALHMPGHIYSQTAKLAEAQRSFSLAADKERGYLVSIPGHSKYHHGHNVHYLALVQAADGKVDAALQSARELLAISETPAEKAQKDNSSIPHRQGYFAQLRTLVWAERWDAILDDQVLEPLPSFREKAWRHWARGLAFAAKGQLPAAQEEAKALQSTLREFREQLKRKPPKELQIAAQELHGHLQLAQGKTKDGLRNLQQASVAERALRYNEPPFYPRPVADAWATAAQKSGNAALAAEAWRIALEQFPGFQRGEQGLAKATSQPAQPSGL